MKTDAYLADGTRISIPDDQFDSLPPDATAEPLRGVRFTLAVILDCECVGWILAEDLA